MRCKTSNPSLNIVNVNLTSKVCMTDMLVGPTVNYKTLKSIETRGNAVGWCEIYDFHGEDCESYYFWM
jgi:hypothetical protein